MGFHLPCPTTGAGCAQPPCPSALAHSGAGIRGGTAARRGHSRQFRPVRLRPKRQSVRGQTLFGTAHDLPDGYPSGRIGLYTNVADAEFKDVRILNDAETVDMAGRWLQTLPATHARIDPTTDRLRVDPHNLHDPYSPVLLRGVRAERFQVTFVMRTSGEGMASFVFDAQDKDHFSEVVLVMEEGAAAVYQARKIEDGKAPVVVSNMGNETFGGASDPLWVRITSDGTTLTVHGKISATEPTSWDQLLQTTGFDLSGGMIGFKSDMVSSAATIDDLVVRRWNTDTSGFDIIDHIDRFTVDGSGYAAEDLEHDAAGNLTYDGVFAYTYDAWNRLVAVARAYRDGGSVQSGGVINTIRYDGRGRRIVKAVRNSADLDATYHYYYDGDSMIETRNGSGWAVKQHVWGVMYVDEIVQIGVLDWAVPPEPGEMTNWYWVMQDANYNVVGVLDWGGLVVERYEYSPYGERTVFRSAGAVVDAHGTPAGHTKYWPGADDPDLYAPTYMSRRVSTMDFGVQPFGICDIGHQGLMLDEETGNYDNRARIYIPRFGRFGQQDPLGYVDGMGLYEYVRSSPLRRLDPFGLWEVDGHFYTVYMVAIAAGVDAERAHRLAYFAQLPDQVADYSATTAGADRVGKFGLWLDGGDQASYQAEIQYRRDIQELLHSLSGGYAPDRRACLRELLRDPNLEDWERGLILHAYGDAYTHSRVVVNSRRGTRSEMLYSGPRGHAPRTSTDKISHHPDKYRQYIASMYLLLGGDSLNVARNRFGDVTGFYEARMQQLDLRSRALPKDGHAAIRTMATLARSPIFGYNKPFAPESATTSWVGGRSDGATDPTLGSLDRSKVEAVMEKIRNACCR